MFLENRCVFDKSICSYENITTGETRKTILFRYYTAETVDARRMFRTAVRRRRTISIKIECSLITLK